MSLITFQVIPHYGVDIDGLFRGREKNKNMERMISFILLLVPLIPSDLADLDWDSVPHLYSSCVKRARCEIGAHNANGTHKM